MALLLANQSPYPQPYSPHRRIHVTKFQPLAPSAFPTHPSKSQIPSHSPIKNNQDPVAQWPLKHQKAHIYCIDCPNTQFSHLPQSLLRSRRLVVVSKDARRNTGQNTLHSLSPNFGVLSKPFHSPLFDLVGQSLETGPALNLSLLEELCLAFRYRMRLVPHGFFHLQTRREGQVCRV